MSRGSGTPGSDFEVIRLKTDILIIGGGTAGCFAAVAVKEQSPGTDVLVVEKAHIKRSGCLAAGVNAINAYLNPGETPRTYLEYVRRDSAGLVREDLVYTIGQRLNRVTDRLRDWGLPFVLDEAGRYKARGRRSVEIIGEGIKPLLAEAARKCGAKIINRTAATNFMTGQGRVTGVYAFSTREKKFYVIKAGAVICATGGAAGIYRPNNEGLARHKMWYCPFNTGAGLAMGLRAGAEMTTFEMRFIALRLKDVISPTGTVAQGWKARQVNGMGHEYQDGYGSHSTPMRLSAALQENRAGRGPCYLDMTHVPEEFNSDIKKAYLSMSPGIVLKWADEGLEPTTRPLELCGTEPYIVGGHGQAGYWVGADRQTTLSGLFAAGDAAGGAPKKYVTGCLAEGEIAALAALDHIGKAGSGSGAQEREPDEAARELERVTAPLARNIRDGAAPPEFEERLQKIMDEYAGGISEDYGLCEVKLLRARELAAGLAGEVNSRIAAADNYELVRSHEVIDRVLLARVLIEHLLYRRETRWPVYQERLDYPGADDDRWLTFVNSLYDQAADKIDIRERPFTRLAEVLAEGETGCIPEGVTEHDR